MFARVTTMQGSLDRIDEAAWWLQEQGVPFARQLSGIKNAHWLADRQTGKVLAVALWESEEAMRASEAEIEPRRAAAAQAMGATVESVEAYEVIAQA